ncbi:TonB-dependent receptor [Caulobacter sp. NIBR1757]|uniref:TonB-dependent receptor plug domain-containing protein n=1 Tax=Caulobacter sp. NIBR1757 TaxID=3016000 RepID=UPI0022F0AB8B|nr:TonB-dependent receptor [Caulobacter sp. NIBR1757]WGM38581.1 Vitamin B12 transporter BtuB [Caulobacter sp. NIBR1757]
MKTRSFRRYLAAGAALGVLLTAAPALAQSEPAPAPEEADVSEVVVTGSRIAGAGETGAIAVSTVGEDQIDAAGADTTGEIMANIPQAGGMEFNETSDGPNSARGDIATVNLRGLGAGNTLVLLNGRRMTPFARSQDIDQSPRQVVNVNEIPAGAIDRIEVLRDGASALYGADATAGVVNTVLKTDYEGLRITSRYGGSEGTAMRQTSVDIAGGWTFNDDRTNLIVVGSWFQRDGLLASEREYSRSVDTRRLLPASWADDTQFRNTSNLSPWGTYQAGAVNAQGLFVGQRVRLGTPNITNTSGVFHIQPVGDAGTTAITANPAIGLDDGVQNSSLFYDFNDVRQVTPDVERFTLFSQLTHDLGNGTEAFAELSYYNADTYSERAAQPIDDSLAYIVVPKQNYWNPFGPVGSPNRIPGITTGTVTPVPAAGLDVLTTQYRPIDQGSREITTESESYRIVTGLRGQWGDWDWETGVFYHRANTTDMEGNTMSKTLFAQQLALTTPDAYNVFGGPSGNSQTALDAVRITSTNRGATSLTGLDFKISRADLWTLPAGGVGAAFGADFRREWYMDDRDPRLDGSIRFGDGLGGNRSDIVGVSPTDDSEADRKVFALFGEVLVPLVSPDMNIPLVHRLDLQLAARAESFSDTGEFVVKPKIAGSWYPFEWTFLRAAYAEGFRAPNLVQLYRGDISRLNLGQEDFWRSDVTGLADDTGVGYRRSVRQSNPDLESEETTTKVLGWVIKPPKTPFGTFQASVDWWMFHQENVIDNFGVEEALALDFLLRKQGQSNPNVIRKAVTPDDITAFALWNAANPLDQRPVAGAVDYVIDSFLNLDPRDVEGLDFAISWRGPKTDWGRLSFEAEATQLLRYDQERKSLEPLLNDPILGPSFTAQQVDRIQLNGNPEWRASGTLTWRMQNWGVGAGFRYVGEFYDTSATNDVTGEFWKVDEWLTFNLYADYRFDTPYLDGVRLRVGANNIENKAPPLADEGAGYFAEYHDNRGRFLYAQIRIDF